MTVPKKKIIISTYDSVYNPYYRGGGAMALHTLAVSLQKWYDVTVITGAYPRSQNGPVQGVMYQFVGFPWLGPKVSQILFHFFIMHKAMTDAYDLWLESFTPPWSTSFLPLFSPKPVIGIAHMLSAMDMGRKYGIPFHLIERIGLTFYKYCVVVSPFQVKILKRLSPATVVRLISNGVKMDTTPATPKVLKKKQFLFLGRIEYDQKGIDILLKGFAKYLETNTGSLIIAGSGNPKDISKMNNLIKKLKISNSVTTTGYVKGDEKAQLIRESMALVMASRYETYGMSALEAFAHGTVVIAPNSEYFTWLPNDASYQFESENPEALATLMQEVSTHEQIRHKKEVLGIHFAKTHTWKSSVIGYREIIESALSSDFTQERVDNRRHVVRFLTSIGNTIGENCRHLSFILRDKLTFVTPRIRK